jgi:hypothetical protein
MSFPDDSPRYHSYLLRFWQERRGSAGSQAVWRFSLDDPRTGRRRGFAGLDALIAAVQREMDAAGVLLVSPSSVTDSMEELP